MVKGIRFELPNKRGQYIQQLLSCFDLDNYFWNISHDEICGVQSVSGSYKGKEIVQAFPDESYYCIAMIIKGFADDKVQSIKNREDFEKSSCEVLVIIDDVVYGEIILKREEALDAVHKKLSQMGAVHIQMMTEAMFPTKWNYA